MQSKQFRSIHFRYQRGASTLKNIREAFTKELFLRGFHQIKVHDLTQRAKLTRGAFYNYWGSTKECLADIMLIRADLDEDKRIKTELEGNMSSPSLLVHRIRDFLFIKTRIDLQSYYLPLFLLQEKSFLNTELSGLLRKCLKHMRTEWEKVIERDQKKGLIRSHIEKENTSVCILNFLSGMIQNMGHDTENGELNRFLKAAMNHFVCSLLTERHLKMYLSPKKRESITKTQPLIQKQALLRKGLWIPEKVKSKL